MNDQLQAALTKLADKLGTTADHLWAVLLKQVQVQIVTDYIIIGLCLLGICAFGIWVIPYFWKKRCAFAKDNTPYPFNKENWWWIGVAAGWIVILVCVVNMCGALYELPTLLMNPEYWALREIMSVLR